MGGILFLYRNQRDSDNRIAIWNNVENLSSARLVTEYRELEKAITTANCIITHREEYKEACEAGTLGESVPIVVFTGGLHGRTIAIDKLRGNTYWLPFEMLSVVDTFLVELFALVKNGEDTDCIKKHINTMVSELLDIPRKISDISPYLLLGEANNIPESHRQKFDQLKKDMLSLDNSGNWRNVARRYL